MEVFTYEGYLVQIFPATRKEKPIYEIFIDGRYIVHVSNVDTAKRIATRFLDVINEGKFMKTRQGKTRNQ